MNAYINFMVVGRGSGALNIDSEKDTTFAFTSGDYGRGQSVQVRKRKLNDTVIIGLFASPFPDMGMYSDSYLPKEWQDSEVIYEHWYPMPGYKRDIE